MVERKDAVAPESLRVEHARPVKIVGALKANVVHGRAEPLKDLARHALPRVLSGALDPRVVVDTKRLGEHVSVNANRAGQGVQRQCTNACDCARCKKRSSNG